MATTSTECQDIPGTAPEQDKNLFDDETRKLFMGAPMSQLFGESDFESSLKEILRNCEELDHGYYRPLYHAALKGDWQAAKCFLEANPDAATARVSVFGRTAMHVAAIEGHAEFVEKLLEVMPAEAVALPDASGSTALHYAAGSANMKSVKALVRKYPSLTQSMDRKGWTPLLVTIGGGFDQKEMSSSKRSECKDVIWFLSLVTTDEEPGCPFSGPQAGNLSFLLTYGGYYDISLFLHKRCPNLLAAGSEQGATALHALAQRPGYFHSGCRFQFWESLIYSFVPVQLNHAPPCGISRDIENIQEKHVDLIEKASIVSLESQVFYRMRSFAWQAIEYLVPSVKNVSEVKLIHQQAVELLTYIFTQISQKNMIELMEIHGILDVIAIAADSGVVEMISICLQFIPDLIWFKAAKGYIMEIAIKQRHEKIFTLMNDITLRNQMLVDMVYLTGRGNLLHIAAKLAPTPQLTSVSGAAFQIQRELLWFNEVKKLLSPAYRDKKNEDSKTPWEVFMEEHKELLEKGERWMKDTSNYLMLVTTLIATVFLLLLLLFLEAIMATMASQSS